MLAMPPKMPWPVPSNIQPIIDRSCVLNLLPVRNNNDLMDFSTFRNHGTIVGASWKTTSAGPGLVFDGEDDFINCGNVSSLNIKSITIEVWVNMKTKQNCGIIDKNADGCFSLLYWAPGTDLYDIYLRIGGATVEFVFPNFTTLGWDVDEWHHLVFTYDGTMGICYTDGTGQTPQAQSGDIDTNNSEVWIGKRNVENTLFDGTIGEVRIYNRALSAGEILRMFEWRKAAHGI